MPTAADLGLSEKEYQDALNLEKIYTLIQENDIICADCRATPTHFDPQSLQFLCSRHARGYRSAKEIGCYQFKTFEVQKLQRQYVLPIKPSSNTRTIKKKVKCSRKHKRSESGSSGTTDQSLFRFKIPPSKQDSAFDFVTDGSSAFSRPAEPSSFNRNIQAPSPFGGSNNLTYSQPPKEPQFPQTAPTNTNYPQLDNSTFFDSNPVDYPNMNKGFIQNPQNPQMYTHSNKQMYSDITATPINQTKFPYTEPFFQRDIPTPISYNQPNFPNNCTPMFNSNEHQLYQPPPRLPLRPDYPMAPNYPSNAYMSKSYNQTPYGNPCLLQQKQPTNFPYNENFQTNNIPKPYASQMMSPYMHQQQQQQQLQEQAAQKQRSRSLTHSRSNNFMSYPKVYSMEHQYQNYNFDRFNSVSPNYMQSFQSQNHKFVTANPFSKNRQFTNYQMPMAPQVMYRQLSDYGPQAYKSSSSIPNLNLNQKEWWE